MQQNHTKLGTHHYMLVLLVLIKENTKGTMLKCCLASEISSSSIYFPPLFCYLF